MRLLLLVPLLLQGAAMFADEMLFHRKRGLPRWERIGHPLDTLTVVLAYLWALVHAPTRGAIIGYAAIAFFSCLFVTKDEPIHARLCTAGEHWLHAVQFILHPIVFLAFGLLWIDGAQTGLLWSWLGATLVFGVYQLVYWSRFWKEPG
jgi:hypothetical protein